MLRLTKIKIILISTSFLVIPSIALGDAVGQRTAFFVDPSYDLNNRSQLMATLQKISSKLYFYIDEDWWKSLEYSKKQEIEEALRSLDKEFSSKIYPGLTSTFGEEWKPGIDKDERITILIHPMREGAGGYFNSADEYPTAQAPSSNQREMIYLNSGYITENLAKSFLAHEFTHLITFNQKEKKYGIEEEVWLNEARAEYAPTLLGYDDQFEGSNLQRRVEIFIKNPSDPLTEWKNEKADYGILNIFIQYLVDYYGVDILTDSLDSKKIGIPSLNQALKENGFEEDFSQIFTDWTLAVSINDCQINPKYCYKNPNLRDLRATPSLIYLPASGETSLSVTYLTKDWAANWYKIIGGRGKLKLEFRGSSTVNFRVPYLVQDFEGNLTINFLELDQYQKGEIYLPDFGTKNLSLTLIPSIQTKISGFSDLEPFYSFSLSALTIGEKEEEEELIKKLLAQIEELKKEIAIVQAKINAILAEKFACQEFENNLYYGMMDNSEVECLQEFLKSQGPEIYPEGLVTGNFLTLTKAAVIKFQEKYADEILSPLGLEKGTGFFGPSTRTKANQILSE